MVLVLLSRVSLMLVMPTVANKPFMLSGIMLNVVMLSVIMLNIVAPFSKHKIDALKYIEIYHVFQFIYISKFFVEFNKKTSPSGPNSLAICLIP
jgi:hypothetical protein